MGQFRLEVGFRKKEFDLISKGVLRAIKEDLGINSVKKAAFVEFFELQLNEPERKVQEIAREVFVDPVIQKASLNEPLETGYGFAVKVKLHDTITDNVALTARHAVEDFLNRKFSENESVKYGRLYLFYGKPTEEEIRAICIGLLSNPQIEEFKVAKSA